MKRGWVLLLIGVNLVALIALAFAYPHLMLSPGPLLRAHAELTTDCFACHASWRGVASKLCIDCHALPDIGLRSTKGTPLPAKAAKVAFHQELIEQDCMACHSDHEGLRQARRSRKAFSHELLRTATRERCEACHQAPADKLHQRISADCKRCHVAQHWKPATLDHAKLFVLDRDHDVKCETCHERGDFSRYTCYGCHEHGPEATRAKHQEEGIRDFENCVECHRSADEKPRERGSHEGRERGGERSGERRRERD